jgi:hypothetical protein
MEHLTKMRRKEVKVFGERKGSRTVSPMDRNLGARAPSTSTSSSNSCNPAQQHAHEFHITAERSPNATMHRIIDQIYVMVSYSQFRLRNPSALQFVPTCLL